jgi:hypothetical protein
MNKDKLIPTLFLTLWWLSVPIVIILAYVIGRIGGTIVGSISEMAFIHYGLIDPYDPNLAGQIMGKGYTALCQLGFGLYLAMVAAYNWSPCFKQAVSFTTLGIYIGSTLTQFFISYYDKLADHIGMISFFALCWVGTLALVITAFTNTHLTLEENKESP